jgi:hypothetical protein
MSRLRSSLPAVHDDGVATDPLGRRGIELSVGRGDEQMQVFFDPHGDAALSWTMSFGAKAIREGVGRTTTALLSAKWVPAAAGPAA